MILVKLNRFRYKGVQNSRENFQQVYCIDAMAELKQLCRKVPAKVYQGIIIALNIKPFLYGLQACLPRKRTKNYFNIL